MSKRPPYKSALCLIALSAILRFPVATSDVSAQTRDTQATPDPILLEIVDDWIGMVPYWGKWLNFRLYASGRVEYEKLTESQENHQTKPIRHEMQLNKQDCQAILNLLEAADFRDACEQYKELWSGIDAVYVTVIHSNPEKRSKSITLVNFIASDPKGRGYYPESIITLMKEIERLRKE